jgi:hypothetical protein
VIRTRDLRRVKAVPESSKDDSGHYGAVSSKLNCTNVLNSNSNGINVELTYNLKELQVYTHARTTGLADHSKRWIVKSSEIFWQRTAGQISPNSINSFYEHTISQFTSKDSWSKLINFAKGFLKYLAKTHFNPLFEQF